MTSEALEHLKMLVKDHGMYLSPTEAMELIARVESYDATKLATAEAGAAALREELDLRGHDPSTCVREQARRGRGEWADRPASDGTAPCTCDVAHSLSSDAGKPLLEKMATLEALAEKHRKERDWYDLQAQRIMIQRDAAEKERDAAREELRALHEERALRGVVVHTDGPAAVHSELERLTNEARAVANRNSEIAEANRRLRERAEKELAESDAMLRLSVATTEKAIEQRNTWRTSAFAWMERAMERDGEADPNISVYVQVKNERDAARAEVERLKAAIQETCALADRLNEMAAQGAGFVGHWGGRVTQALRPLRALSPSRGKPEGGESDG